jgi:Ras-related protein Rab-8A
MGILFVYSITNSRSFQNIRGWISNVEQHAPETVSKILIANHCHVTDRVGVAHGTPRTYTTST